MLWNATNNTLSGKFLRVTMAYYRPFTYRRGKKGSYVFSGLTVNILDALAEALNFRYELYQIPDRRFGSVDANGTWNGMVGDVLYGKADMAAAALTINSARAQVVDFSTAFWEEPSGVLVRRDEDTTNFLLAMFQPLHAWVWLAVLAALVFTAIAMFAVARLHRSTQGYSVPSRDKDGLFDSLWYCAGTFLLQGAHRHPSPLPLRAICMSWFLCGLVLYVTYSANLTASLTITKHSLPFYTLQQMVQQSEYTFGVSSGNGLRQVFEASTGGVYQEIHKRLIPVKGNSYGVNQVKSAKYAHMADYNRLQREAAKNCTLRLIDETFYKVGLGFALPKGSPYKDDIDKVLLVLIESGLIQQWADSTFPKPQCDTEARITASTLTLEDMTGIFVILAAGLVLASMFLLLESQYHSYAKSTSTCSGFAKRLSGQL